MLPVTDDLLQDFTVEEQPSYTYEMRRSSARVQGHCNGIEAMQQAIFKILNTERYVHSIYSWNYGIELADLFGKPTSYCIPEIERRVKEALLQDTRIKSVDNFVFDLPKRNVVHVAFTATTDYGAVAVETEVNI